MVDDEVRAGGDVERIELGVRARPESVATVRRALERLAAPRNLLADAKLLVTELVGNSIRHAGLRPDEDITVRASWSGRTLRVSVLDGATHPFVVGRIIRRPRPGVGSGWGLYLVDRLATRWGVGFLRGGSGYWFELDLRPEAAG